MTAFYVYFYVRATDLNLQRTQTVDLIGAGTRNRTRDLLITSQLLYLLSYTGKEGRLL